MTHYKVSIVIEREDDWYVALCPELDVASQGRTIEEARNNLKEAIELYLESADPSEIQLSHEPPFVSTLDVAVK
jgi:predicted RNase H-like HicB family nuclease